MNIELIRWPTEADWLMAKRCALVTVGKDSETPPTEEWKRRSLEARHSYIRELRFVFRITGIPYWVAMHLVRHHVGCQPYIKTQRNDRQKVYDRGEAPQNAPVDMMWSMNAEALMNLANKRLCFLAAKETREVVIQMCKEVESVCPEFINFLVTMCEYHGWVCHEMQPCGRLSNGM